MATDYSTYAYTVRYESDGQVTRIHFEMDSGPRDEDGEPLINAKEIVQHAAGLLFLNDCCPGEKFCVYENDDRSMPVVAPGPHHYYGDSDDLWPGTDTEIMDL